MKKAIIISLIAVVVGFSLAITGFAITGCDLNSISNVSYRDEDYFFENDLTEIEITSDSPSVRIEKSTDGLNRVLFHVNGEAENFVSVNDGKMTVKSEDKSWHFFVFNIGFDNPLITVKLNEKEYEKITVKMSSGSVFFTDEVNAKSLDISCTSGSVNCKGQFSDGKIETSSGSVYIENGNCSNLSVLTSSGSVRLNKTVASGNLTVNTSSGSVSLDRIDGNYLEIKTSSGSVHGTVLTQKIFVTSTGSGSVNVPQTTTGNICKITTSSGSIKIEYV